MAHLHRAVATLRISGDNLMPSEISVLLGTEPTLAREKGKEWRTPKGGVRIATFGQSHLNASDTKPENLDDQVAELLGKLRTDLSVWSKLSTAFEMTFFAGGLCKRATMGLKFKTRQQAMQEIIE